MKHFITRIYIEKLRHLTDIEIPLNSEKKQHLLITGKNGSGKTTLLLAIEKYLTAINEGKLNTLRTSYKKWVEGAEQELVCASSEKEKYEAQKKYDKSQSLVLKYKDGIEMEFQNMDDLDSLYKKGHFITAFFPANRKITMDRPNGVVDIRLQEFYGIDQSPGNILLKYMIHLKTQQSYARNEGDFMVVDKIQAWFDRFEKALKTLLDNDTVSLEYNYREYNFKIKEKNRDAFQFDELSDGYSSLIHIVSDLILRMDQNWLLKDNLSTYDVEGIVLIDELETHLHIELQKKILPFLTTFFPGIQFIVTTHSPYVLTSISNAKCYDLENKVELENLSLYSSEDLAEAYFNVDEYSIEVATKIERYRWLLEKENLSEEERAERAELRLEFKNNSANMARELKQIIYEIESSRKSQ